MKPRFNIEDYKDKYVMHCNTEEKANVFCKYLNSVGRKWNSDCSYLEANEWAYYEEDTCYNFDWSEEEKENNMRKAKVISAFPASGKSTYYREWSQYSKDNVWHGGKR